VQGRQRRQLKSSWRKKGGRKEEEWGEKMLQERQEQKLQA
jgi:hypothetical protein